MIDLTSLKSKSTDSAFIIPFGGCGQFGMNLTSYIISGQHIVVDCGAAFPSAKKLGIDAIFANVNVWFERLGRPDAYLLTHGHEDHIGALPHIFKRWPAPIYSTSWTHQLILNRLSSETGASNAHIIDKTKVLKIGRLEVEWIEVAHSVPMSCAIFFRSRTVNIFHSADFKFNGDSNYEGKTDVGRLNIIRRQGVDLLLADSTNSETSGFCPAESKVEAPLMRIIGESRGVTYIAIFSSNFWRLRIIARICKKLGRKLCIIGTSLEKTLEMAKTLHLAQDLVGDILVSEQEATQLPGRKLVVLATGCQGEPHAIMARIVNGTYKHFSLTTEDSAVFSSRIIPGNEVRVLGLINGCKKAGAAVYTTKTHPQIHASGHAHKEDIKALLKTLKPKAFIPIHGAFANLRENADLALGAGIAPEKCKIIENGDVVKVSRQGLSVVDSLAIEKLFVDSWSSYVTSPSVLRERLKIGELGLAIVSGIYDKERTFWLKTPTFDTYGLPFPTEQERQGWERLSRSDVETSFAGHEDFSSEAVADLYETLRISVRRHLKDIFHKKPTVIVKIFIV